MKIWKLALRNIFRNRRRSILSASAAAVAACTIVFLFAFFGGMMEDMEYNLQTYLTGAVRIRHADFDRYERLNPLHLALPDASALVSSLEALPEVESVSPRINFPGLIIVKEESSASGKSAGETRQIRAAGQGVDFALESVYGRERSVLVKGSVPEPGSRQALVGSALAEELNADVGDKFTVLSLSGSRGSNAYTFTVSGIMSLPLTGLNKVLFQVPLDTAQRFLHLENRVQEILVKTPGSGLPLSETARFLEKELRSSVPLSIRTYKEINGLAAMMDLAAKVYDLIGLIFFVLAGTVVINTTIMVIFERMHEIGTLGAMGMKGRQLVRLFFLESLFISVSGSLTGVVAGIGLVAFFAGKGLNFMALESTVSEIGVGTIIYPVLNLRSTLVVFVYSVAVAVLVTWLPARRAARVTPVEALNYL